MGYRKRRRSLDAGESEPSAYEDNIGPDVYDNAKTDKIKLKIPKERIPVDTTREVKEAKERRPIHISLGERLRLALARDWELIFKKQSLFSLPSVLTVEMIVDRFRQSQVLNRDLDEFCDGLLAFFDVLLPRALLFRIERHQLLELYNPASADFSASHIYGAEHLGRLFSNF
jgi:hypothetical protein